MLQWSFNANKQNFIECAVKKLCSLHINLVDLDNIWICLWVQESEAATSFH